MLDKQVPVIQVVPANKRHRKTPELVSETVFEVPGYQTYTGSSLAAQLGNPTQRWYSRGTSRIMGLNWSQSVDTSPADSRFLTSGRMAGGVLAQPVLQAANAAQGTAQRPWSYQNLNSSHHYENLEGINAIQDDLILEGFNATWEGINATQDDWILEGVSATALEESLGENSLYCV